MTLQDLHIYFFTVQLHVFVVFGEKRLVVQVSHNSKINSKILK